MRTYIRANIHSIINVRVLNQRIMSYRRSLPTARLIGAYFNNVPDTGPFDEAIREARRRAVMMLAGGWFCRKAEDRRKRSTRPLRTSAERAKASDERRFADQHYARQERFFTTGQ